MAAADDDAAARGETVDPQTQPERGWLGRVRSQEVVIVVTAQATVDKIAVPAVISIRCSSPPRHQLPPLCTKWPAGHAAGKKMRKFPELRTGGGATACRSVPRRRRAPVVIAAQLLGVNDIEQPFAWCPEQP